MKAVRLHGVRDLRLEDLPDPPSPRGGEALVRVTAAGICGSDLHTYTHARIGNTQVTSPLVLGHEFAGVVMDCGRDAVSGDGSLLSPGFRVAVDPAAPCGACPMCLRGDVHLCSALHFCGLYPDDGCFREMLLAPARSCFVLPDQIDDSGGAMLEPLGIAMHAAEFCRIRKGDTVALFGAGPIGLLVLQLIRLGGAGAVFVVEPLLWRLRLAERFGGIPLAWGREPGSAIMRETGGKGVDVAVECAWADVSIQQAAEAAAPGGRIVLVGIPGDDRLSMNHSTARRKELSLVFSRRMKGTYPEAIRLVREKTIDVQSLITHSFPLADLPAAFELNAAYRDGVVKVMISLASPPTEG